jgi:hypothetical protein
MRRFLLIGLLIQPLLAVVLWAHTDRATISGTVTDPTGAVIPGVTVTATNVETGIRTNAVTNQAGIYSLLNLPIGRYSVSFAKEGFQKLDRSGISLSVRQVADLSITLNVGETAIAVTVTDDVPPLQTETSDVGTTPMFITASRNHPLIATRGKATPCCWEPGLRKTGAKPLPCMDWGRNHQ